MKDVLFKKILVFTDIHFGKGGSNQLALKDNLEFLRWAVDRGKSWGADQCVFMGDYFDSRHSISTITLAAALDGLDIINDAFSKTYMISGNHDLPYREKREATSIEIARNLSNIQIIRDPTTIDNVTFLPWLVGDEYKKVKNIKSRYVFGHLEMPGFMMNAKVELPDSEHLIKPDQFDHQEYVFTGHFHMRQHKTFGKTTSLYMGNAMPHNFSDANDEDRGIMLLEWGKDPVFEAWPDQPLYRTVKMSELLADPASILKPKMTVRATVDIQLQFEDAQDIRDALETEYGIRKIELIHTATADESDQEYNTDIEFKSVDQMVLDGIQSIESIDISPIRLAEIYRSLG